MGGSVSRLVAVPALPFSISAAFQGLSKSLFIFINTPSSFGWIIFFFPSFLFYDSKTLFADESEAGDLQNTAAFSFETRSILTWGLLCFMKWSAGVSISFCLVGQPVSWENTDPSQLTGSTSYTWPFRQRHPKTHLITAYFKPNESMLSFTLCTSNSPLLLPPPPHHLLFALGNPYCAWNFQISFS